MISRRQAVAGIGLGATLPFLTARATAATAPIVAPIALDDERVLVAVGINGQGPYIFVIDTGGTVSLIDTALAAQLKLPIVAANKISGGGGIASSAVYRVSEFVIGAVMRERDVPFQGVTGFGFGKQVRGTLGSGAMTAYDSVLDFDREEWRIYPDGFGDLPGFTAIDSRISHPRLHGTAYIYATATLDGQAFRFLLDTGAPAALRLYPEAVRRTSYWDDPKRAYAPMRRGGVGGPGAIDRMIRAGAFEFGGVRVDGPLVMLDGAARGQRVADGVIGLPLIRQFNLATDVRRSRLLLQRNRQPVLRQTAPISGMWLDDRGGTTVVADVGRGSPAAAAGVAAGDRIVGQTLAQVVRQLGGPPGRIVPLTIERGGQQHDLTVTLRAYL